MRRYLMLVTLLVSVFVASAQPGKPVNPSVLLAKVNSMKDAEGFIEKNPSLSPVMIFFNPDLDRGALEEPVYTLSVGAVFTIGQYMFKVLEADSALNYKVQYIYLNGESYSKPEIDSIRTDIINQYKAGTPFSQLAATYTMDMNPTGELNWFRAEEMVAPFSEAVKKHKKGDIFTVDTPDRKWYHVVLKTENGRMLKRVVVLRIKVNKG